MTTSVQHASKRDSRKTMKIHISFAAAALALAAVELSCTTVPGRPGGVYLVGVAGGG